MSKQMMHDDCVSAFSNDKNVKTYLSSKVYSLICEAGITHEVYCQNSFDTTTFFDAKGLLNLDLIIKLLPVHTEDNYDYFLKSCISLAPVFAASEKYFFDLGISSSKLLLLERVEWTSHPEVLKDCIIYLLGDNKVEQLLAILLTTSVVERSLGDLYLINGKQCPSLLKDLLLTENLKKLLGHDIIRLLRILIGPSQSLNLRNIAWHGFPKPGELSRRYCFFMFHIVMTISEILQQQQINSTAIKHREFVTFSPLFEIYLKFAVTNANLSHVLLQSICEESKFLVKGMQNIWSYAFMCYKENRYRDCYVLLLPQLEHSLRKIFASVNGCPERVMTAENTVFFTTCDEILNQYLDVGIENKMRIFVGDNYMDLLLDLLQYPEGPRLRDKISHGECSLNNTAASTNFNPQEISLNIASEAKLICDSLLVVFLAFSSLLSDSTLQTDDDVKRICSVLQDYQPVFHPVSRLICQTCKLADEIHKLYSLKKPKEEEIGEYVAWDTYLKEEEQLCASDMYQAAVHHIDITGVPDSSIQRLLLPFYNLTSVGCYLEEISHEISTLYRFNTEKCQGSDVIREEEIINLLRRLVAESLEVCGHLKLSLDKKYQLWQLKQLRSRQRETYRKILNSMPLIFYGLRMVLFIVVLQLNMIAFHKYTSKNQIIFIKFLKSSLQYVENLKTYTSIDKNKWDRAEESTKHFFCICREVSL